MRSEFELTGDTGQDIVKEIGANKQY